jgi:transposase
MVNKGLEEGLKELASPTSFKKKQALSDEKKKALKNILLKKKPSDFGIDRQIWTGEIIATVIRKKWKVELKDSRIYEILEELELSYQKAHRDYADADSKKQKAFVKLLKKNN